MTQFQFQQRFQQIAALCGFVSVLLFFVGFALAGFIPPPSPSWSAERIATHYQEHVTGIRLGALCILVAGMLYAAYTAVMSGQMARIPGVHRTVIYTQLGAGAFACTAYLLPGLAFQVAAFRPYADPEMVRMLNDMAFIFLVMPWFPFLTQNWAFAFAILSDLRERPLFPRWVAYLNIWAPLTFAPSVILPWFKTGPFAWNGLMVVWMPALIFIVQLGINSWAINRAVGQETREHDDRRRPESYEGPPSDLDLSAPRLAPATPAV